MLTIDLKDLLPATAIVAIVIFIIRETVEYIRRGGERKRKLSAIKALLKDEFEKNYWVFKTMFEVLESLKGNIDEYGHKNITCSLREARNGSEHLRIKAPDGESSRWLAKFQTTTYEKTLQTLAELDKKSFDQMLECYSEIADLQHYRDLTVSFFAGEENTDDVREFLADMSAEKGDYYAELNKGYRCVTNEDLKTFKLR